MARVLLCQFREVGIPSTIKISILYTNPTRSSTQSALGHPKRRLKDRGCPHGLAKFSPRIQKNIYMLNHIISQICIKEGKAMYH